MTNEHELQRDATIFRKNWTTYIWPIIWVGIWSFVAFRYWQNWEQVRAAIPGSSGSDGANFWIAVAVLALIVYFGIRTLWHIAWLTTYRVEVYDYGVHAKSGILPWKKWERTWESAQIFNCLYIQRGILGWLIKHGHLILQGSEGVSQEFKFLHISDVKKACALVNQIRTGGR